MSCGTPLLIPCAPSAGAWSEEVFLGGGGATPISGGFGGFVEGTLTGCGGFGHPGSLGQGGDGGGGGGYVLGGGGGGGYYGGGGGAGAAGLGDDTGCSWQGGGGGSSFGPPGSVFGTGANLGNGSVILTPIQGPIPSLPPPPPPPIGSPSSNCDTGQPVTDSTVEGVHVKLYTRQPSSQEVDVCLRIDDSTANVGYGGEVVITDAPPQVSGVTVPSVGLPSVDNNWSACTDNTPSNQVPGQHPIAVGNVLGRPYLLDTYFNGSAAWVCVQVGTTVNDRVVVPITPPTVGIPSITGGPTVHFNSDPGTPGPI